MFRNTISSFFLFVSLFIGTGFIAGSIVHFGEGITVWDSSVLALGVVMFTVSSYVQEKQRSHTQFSLLQFLTYIFQSLLLSIGIGMASGGTQHFIDTPMYSAILIPAGLWIGLFTFLWREKAAMSLGTLTILLPVSLAAAFGIWIGLLQFNEAIPDELRIGHGSHSVHHGEEVPAVEEDVNQDMHDDHH